MPSRAVSWKKLDDVHQVACRENTSLLCPYSCAVHIFRRALLTITNRIFLRVSASLNLRSLNIKHHARRKEHPFDSLMDSILTQRNVTTCINKIFNCTLFILFTHRSFCSPYDACCHLNISFISKPIKYCLNQ